MLMNKLISSMLFCCTFCISFYANSWANTEQPVDSQTRQISIEPGTFRLTYQNGRLSLSSNAVKIDQVLREVSKKTGVVFDSEGILDKQVSIRFKNEPLESGLKRLIRGYNYFFIYEKVADGSCSNYFYQIRRIMLTGGIDSECKPKNPGERVSALLHNDLDQRKSAQFLEPISSDTRAALDQYQMITQTEIDLYSDAFESALPQIYNQSTDRLSIPEKRGASKVLDLKEIVEAMGKIR
jgi:hypothetical protein